MENIELEIIAEPVNTEPINEERSVSVKSKKKPETKPSRTYSKQSEEEKIKEFLKKIRRRQFDQRPLTPKEIANQSWPNFQEVIKYPRPLLKAWLKGWWNYTKNEIRKNPLLLPLFLFLLITAVIGILSVFVSPVSWIYNLYSAIKFTADPQQSTDLKWAAWSAVISPILSFLFEFCGNKIEAAPQGESSTKGFGSLFGLVLSTLFNLAVSMSTLIKTIKNQGVPLDYGQR